MQVDALPKPPNAALLVVDMQNDFCHERGAIASIGGDPRLIQAMAPRLRRLLDAARQIHLPIVHIRTHHSPWTDSAPWAGRFGRPLRICVPGSWGADYYEGFEPREADEWRPGEHEYVVTKHRYSGFMGTDLDLVLRSHHVETVIMSGEATNVCVESTARDAFMHDYAVAFLSDCTAGTDQGLHDATLVTFARHFGRVLTSDELLAGWERADLLPSGWSTDEGPGRVKEPMSAGTAREGRG